MIVRTLLATKILADPRDEAQCSHVISSRRYLGDTSVKSTNSMRPTGLPCATKQFLILAAAVYLICSQTQQSFDRK